jgi:hypothetical protein
MWAKIARNTESTLYPASLDGMEIAMKFIPEMTRFFR